MSLLSVCDFLLSLHIFYWTPFGMVTITGKLFVLFLNIMQCKNVPYDVKSLR